jgi:hypothetical protein
MKVALPAGASMLSVEVAGSTAKPVEGKDGSRVPLLRPGFRPDGVYVVSFVYLHAGTPFLKKGDMQMTLPKMDVPVNVVEWELFVPDRFRVDHFDGDMFDAGLMPTGGVFDGLNSSIGGEARPQIRGRIVDEGGAALPGVTVLVEGAGQRQSVVTDANGSYNVSNVPSGPVTFTARIQGFKDARRTVQMDQRARQVDMTLAVSGATESVTVTAEAPVINMQSSTSSRNDPQGKSKVVENEAPSANVQNLQRRVSGVLPVRMEVPRAGTSHRFVKPLVIDEETRVTFRYKRR